MLKDNGFWLKRKNGKHPVFTDGISSIPIPTSRKEHKGRDHNIRKQVERAVALRPTQKEDQVQHVPKSTFANHPKVTAPPVSNGSAPKDTVQKTTKEVWEAVKPMRAAGVKYGDIADRLALMGYTTKTGKKYDVPYLSKIALTYGGDDFRTRFPKWKRKKKQGAAQAVEAAPAPERETAPKTAPPSHAGDAFHTIADIALSNLGDVTKKQLLRTLIESI